MSTKPAARSITPDSVSRALTRYVGIVGIDIKGYGPHALSAEAATNALEHNADIIKAELRLHTPVNNLQSNGMAGSFVNTFKRDYVGCMDRSSGAVVLAQLPDAFGHFNEVHPHPALGTNRRACLGKSDVVRLSKLTLIKHQALQAIAGQDQSG